MVEKFTLLLDAIQKAEMPINDKKVILDALTSYVTEVFKTIKNI
jgi:hypothetical protein